MGAGSSGDPGITVPGGGGAPGRHAPLPFVANRVLTWMENHVFGRRLAECYSGYMLYRREALEAVPFRAFAPRGFVFARAGCRRR